MHFYKHQKAILLNGLLLVALNSVAFTSSAGHVLLTEDTSTQGAGNFLLEFMYEQSRHEAADAQEVGRDTVWTLYYGLLDPLDLILGVPYSQLEVTGSPDVSGVGDMELAVKWRFYEKNALSFALRPGIVFGTGDETQGLGTGKNTANMFGVMSYDAAPWWFHLHAGITDNRSVPEEREHLTHYSAAVTRSFGDQWQLVADISRETNPDLSSNDDIESALFGIVYMPVPRFELNAGYRAAISDSAADVWLLGAAIQF